ncbi:hypothetical protein GUJ93_ZPchr0011g27965 [Zizania palustris]|uniref:Uncharacterized protein n=1 Tax=Zizania palustris TaxID=103762 RepID=A0A8J6BRN3_ZIZPA|nr:hypothetical protein GUJ93_ZPchr0011g27965 [Zizania palustris]
MTSASEGLRFGAYQLVKPEDEPQPPHFDVNTKNSLRDPSWSPLEPSLWDPSWSPLESSFQDPSSPLRSPLRSLSEPTPRASSGLTSEPSSRSTLESISEPPQLASAKALRQVLRTKRNIQASLQCKAIPEPLAPVSLVLLILGGIPYGVMGTTFDAVRMASMG